MKEVETLEKDLINAIKFIPVSNYEEIYKEIFS